MKDTERKKKEFVAYEYKEIIAEKNKASLLIDGYENFGWELDDNLNSNLNGNGIGIYESKHSPNVQKVKIRMKRNMKIVNKMELTRLQRNFEACVKEIDILEKAKTSKAMIYALTIGVIGTAFMAGSVFAVTAQPPHIVLSVLLAVPAFIGWVCPYFVYRKTVNEETERIVPLIEDKYNEIYELCEKGNKLLY